MDTSPISYRVADFLKQHPPFQAMDDADLLELAGRGRVKFHEANEFILWQGEPHKSHVFVIQQGVVTLWDETDGRLALRDVCGGGDLLGTERFIGAPHSLYSARSSTDVVIYAFPESDFEELVLKDPYARRFMAAYETVASDSQPTHDTRDLQNVFLHTVIGRKPLETISSAASIREAAAAMLATGSEAVASVDHDRRLGATVSVRTVLAWVASGAGDANQPITALGLSAAPVIGSAALVTDGVLTLLQSGADGLAVTLDGSSSSELQAFVTTGEIGRVFGDRPTSILREIRRASTPGQLRDLNHRARTLTHQYLTSPASIDWLAPVMFLTDVNIVKRIIALVAGEMPSACWCFCGASGRRESLTRHAPRLVLIIEDESRKGDLERLYERVSDALAECDYLARADVPFDRAFHVASKTEWHNRYQQWLSDPIRSEMHLARPLFDLRPVHGPESLWRELGTAVAGATDRYILQVLANDCLASLPPLTFFQDAVIDESGEQSSVFQLEQSALRPLVDVGRVFGLAAKEVLGTSTGERFARARSLLPEHESIFRDAAETLRILLWQQARIGIAQGTDGSELPPALLSRHDRHILKSGFRSILRLIEFTGNLTWLDKL